MLDMIGCMVWVIGLDVWFTSLSGVFGFRGLHFWLSLRHGRRPDFTRVDQKV